MSTDFWRGRSVFVTGATGLLGSWLVPALVRRGAAVVALVRDAVPRSLLVSTYIGLAAVTRTYAKVIADTEKIDLKDMRQPIAPRGATPQREGR